MGSFRVVAVYPEVQASLYLFPRRIQLAPESGLVKLIQDGFVETLVDAVCREAE